MAFVLPNEINSPVRASTIDNDVFQIRITLAEHGGDRLLDKGRLIERRRDYGNPWEFQQDANSHLSICSKTNSSMFQEFLIIGGEATRPGARFGGAVGVSGPLKSNRE